ncbi:hypothetical protein L1049_001323 [Liquidambar formosana]|uniref:Protein APEM9 n=1 Tax=Liquidambar formosana TaxID=63359 RepID=A0AAP0R465_LIQFO
MRLNNCFGSVTAIPVQVLLAGACIQISEEANLTYMEGCDGRFVLGLDKYLEVVEVYVVTFLGMVLNNMDLAMSWVEKAALPEEKRQELLRRLHSMYSLKATKSSHGSFSPFPADEHKNCSSLKELNITEESLEALKAQYPPDGDKVTKQAIMKLSGRMDSCFWWFRTFSLKFGNARLVISNGKIVLGCLIFLICYAFRRKQATLKRIARRRAFSMKKALVDLWQLAFSYQVNPLAAVQPLPAAARGSR